MTAIPGEQGTQFEILVEGTPRSYRDRFIAGHAGFFGSCSSVDRDEASFRGTLSSHRPRREGW